MKFLMIKLQAPGGILLRAIAGTYLPATGGTHLSATGGTPRASRATNYIWQYRFKFIIVSLSMKEFIIRSMDARNNLSLHPFVTLSDRFCPCVFRRDMTAKK